MGHEKWKFVSTGDEKRFLVHRWCGIKKRLNITENLCTSYRKFHRFISESLATRASALLGLEATKWTLKSSRFWSLPLLIVHGRLTGTLIRARCKWSDPTLVILSVWEQVSWATYAVNTLEHRLIRSSCGYLFEQKDNNLFITCCNDNKIYQWDTRTGRICQEFNHHFQPCNTVTFFDKETDWPGCKAWNSPSLVSCEMQVKRTYIGLSEGFKGIKMSNTGSHFFSNGFDRLIRQAAGTYSRLTMWNSINGHEKWTNMSGIQSSPPALKYCHILRWWEEICVHHEVGKEKSPHCPTVWVPHSGLMWEKNS